MQGPFTFTASLPAGCEGRRSICLVTVLAGGEGVEGRGTHWMGDIVALTQAVLLTCPGCTEVTASPLLLHANSLGARRHSLLGCI